MPDESKQWVMVRVTRDTHSALLRVMRSLAKAIEQGQHSPPTGADHRISIDAVIAELVKRDESHRRRAKKAKSKPRGKRAATPEQQPPTGA